MQDEYYIKQRNALIPLAEEYANKIVGQIVMADDAERWNKIFHRRMDELAYKTKLTCHKGCFHKA